MKTLEAKPIVIPEFTTVITRRNRDPVYSGDMAGFEVVVGYAGFRCRGRPDVYGCCLDVDRRVFYADLTDPLAVMRAFDAGVRAERERLKTHAATAYRRRGTVPLDIVKVFGRYGCPQCDRTFKMTSWLYRHLQKKHDYADAEFEFRFTDEEGNPL